MENIDKGLTVPKCLLINRPKIPQMPQNLSVQIVCPSPKFGISMKKGFIGHPQSVPDGNKEITFADFAILTSARAETKALDNLDLVQTQMGVENEF